MINKLHWWSFGVPPFCTKQKISLCILVFSQKGYRYRHTSMSQHKYGNLITSWAKVEGGVLSSPQISLWLAGKGHRPLTSLCLCSTDGRDPDFPGHRCRFVGLKFAWRGSPWPRLRREHSHISRKSPHCEFAFVVCMSQNTTLDIFFTEIL